jgi:predicted permease
MSRQFWRRLRFLFRRDRFDRELEEEMRFHIEMRAGDGIEERPAGQRAFGNATLIAEASREVWAFRWLDALGQDARYGLRQLRRSPGFTSVALLSLALGIGANTAVFSVLDAVMLRPLPVADPARLVELRVVTPGEPRMAWSFSYPMFRALLERGSVFAGLFAVADGPPVLALDGQVEHMRSVYASGDFFPTLGATPLAGRALEPEDDRLAQPVAVISHAFWRRRFGLAPDVLGRAIEVEGISLRIVGILPGGFVGVDAGAAPDLYLPLALEARTRPGGTLTVLGHARWLRLMARLRPGVSLAQARANLAALSPGIFAEVAPVRMKPDKVAQFLASRFDLESAPAGLVRLREQFSQPLVLLATVAGLVLVTAAVNLANLVLARGSAREREIAVRLAIGASRARVARQLLTESVLLASLGGAAGVLLAAWGGPALAALMSRDLVLDLRLDGRVLGFALAAAFATGIGFGLLPAARAARCGVAPALMDIRTVGGRGSRLGKALVAAQVALSLLLVAGAGLFLRTLHNLLSLDAGFEREGVLLASADVSRAGFDRARLASFSEQALERLSALPGVRSASVSWAPPVTADWGSDGTFSVEGYEPAAGEKLYAYMNWVGPRFFRTLGTPLAAGREFEPGERTTGVVINETMARRYWPAGSAVGRRIRVYDERDSREVLGVVRDVKYMSLREQTPPVIYLSFAGSNNKRAFFTLRAERVAPASLAESARKEIQALGAGILVTTLTLTEQVDRSLAKERLVAVLSGVFGSLALLLASVGIYGVMAHAVARRTSEIGIRMALGARPAAVVRLVLGETLLVAAAGVALGLPVALAAGRVVSDRLFGLAPGDPATFAGAAAVMLGTALAAGFIPARRAARVDPMEALRHE